MYDEKTRHILNRLKKDRKLLSLVVNKLVSFGDLTPELKDIDSSIGNIYCPFHPSEGLGENKNTPSAKIYYNEEKKMYLIKCFAGKKRSYYAFNYIKLILEEDPYDYLLKNRDISQILEIIDLVDKGYLNLDSDSLEDYKIYINNLYEKVDGKTIEFIEKVYFGEDELNDRL